MLFKQGQFQNGIHLTWGWYRGLIDLGLVPWVGIYFCHSIDMIGLISLVNSQTGNFCIIQDLMKITKSRIIQLLYNVITYVFNAIDCTVCSLYKSCMIQSICMARLCDTMRNITLSAMTTHVTSRLAPRVVFYLGTDRPSEVFACKFQTETFLIMHVY